MKKWWWVGAVALIAGMGISINDYVQWRHMETDRFGQGWADLDRPALTLEELYNDKNNGIRLHLPKGWKVDRELKVAVEYVDGNLTDLVDKEVAELKKAGVNITGELQYVTSEKSAVTIIAYEKDLSGGKTNVIQEAWAKQGGRLIVLRAEVPEEKWFEVKKTYMEIFKSLEIN